MQEVCISSKTSVQKVCQERTLHTPVHFWKSVRECAPRWKHAGPCIRVIIRPRYGQVRWLHATRRRGGWFVCWKRQRVKINYPIMIQARNIGVIRRNWGSNLHIMICYECPSILAGCVGRQYRRHNGTYLKQRKAFWREKPKSSDPGWVAGRCKNFDFFLFRETSVYGSCIGWNSNPALPNTSWTCLPLGHKQWQSECCN